MGPPMGIAHVPPAACSHAECGDRQKVEESRVPWWGSTGVGLVWAAASVFEAPLQRTLIHSLLHHSDLDRI